MGLHPMDNDFFEEYKRLDRLCGDMYASQNGISAYLTAMESKTVEGQRCVACWDSDYRTLKHVRWVRNQIAHDSGTYQLSEPSDLAFVQDFYSRIFSGQDALTLLRKANEQAQSRVQYRTQSASQYTPRYTNSKPAVYPKQPAQPPKGKKGWLGVLVVIGIILLSIAFLFFWR